MIATLSRRTFTTLTSLRLLSTAATALTVPDMTDKPCIQRALENPDSPSSVLTFFYGVDYDDQDEYKKVMRKGTPLKEMQDLWYGGGDEYDEMCQKFIPVIRSVVGEPERLKEEKPEEFTKWNSSVDGLMSQVLLCDQLSRNAFRGKEEAFAHDPLGEKHIQTLVEDYLKHDPLKQSMPGEFYPGYLSFMVTGLMHSEDLHNHDLASKVLEAGIEEYKDEELVTGTLKFQEGFLKEHRDVVEKFGRYPHRNDKKGRETTKEEQEWLDDEENLPGWAKSQ